MNKLTRIAVLCLVAAITFAPAAVLLAADTTDPAEEFVLDPATQAKYDAERAASKASFGYLGVGIGAGLAVVGGGLGIGLLSASVVDASARQPEMANKLLTTMFIAAALIEGLALFVIVLCMLCLFM